MRVLLVTAMVAGGVGAHVRMLARGLVAAGHRVVVACPAEVAERFSLGRTGAVVVPLEVGSGVHPAGDLRAVRELRRLAAGADIVHAHGMRAGALAAVAGAGLRRSGLAPGTDAPATHTPGKTPRRRRRPPLVVTVHNAPPSDTKAALVYDLLERLMHSGADRVLGVSPDLVDRARGRGARQVDLAVVPADLTGVIPAGRRDAVREAVRSELGLEDGQLLLLTVGRLSAQKRTDEVLAAYQAMVGRSSVAAEPIVAAPLVLAVAGDGPALTDLQGQAADGPGQVHLLGRRDDVPELLTAADVVVSGAQWEGQPLWLQEALGAGAAIVATDVGGTGVVVGDAAVLVPVAEGAGPEAVAARVGALRDALHTVLDDHGRRAELAARARRRAGELPSADEAVAAALEAYTRAGDTTYPDRPVEPGRT